MTSTTTTRYQGQSSTATSSAGATEHLDGLAAYLHDARLQITEALDSLVEHAKALRALPDGLAFDPGGDVKGPLTALAEGTPDPAAFAGWGELLDGAERAVKDLQARLETAPGDAKGDIERFVSA